MPSSSHRRAREDSDAEDDIPLIRQRMSFGAQPVQPAMVCSSNVPPAPARDAVETTPTFGIQSFIPPMDRQRAKGYKQQHGGHAAMLKLMDGACGQTCKLTENYKRLTSEKASLKDEVNKLKEELEKARAERDSGIQATKDEASHVEDRAKNTKADRDKALSKLNSLRQWVAVANQNLAHVKEGLRKARSSH
ncbi:hypothetical protein SLEP1_g3023 [Rubroshorea leprosula]|nr:hypothetical protein SLEP1_g3023 [Rubroshorea leprosula]